jgi:ATP-dependent Clp protease ATP-binding subunit ClpA
VPGTAKVEPEPTVGFDRVIQRAVMHAAASSASEVSSGDLLVFMLQEDESHAAYFLKSSASVTLLRVISPARPEPGLGVPAANSAIGRSARGLR